MISNALLLRRDDKGVRAFVIIETARQLTVIVDTSHLGRGRTRHVDRHEPVGIQNKPCIVVAVW